MIDVAQLLSDLTEPQKQAVLHVDGPLLIIAGAGSGKTRVLTRRVAHLMSLGIPGNSVLAITFTNKAAGEMKERVGHLLGHPIRDIGRLDQRAPIICTFHSLCLRVLRYYTEAMGVKPGFSIYDSSDQNKLVKEALKILEMSTSNFPPAQIHSTISSLKNKLVGPEEYARTAGGFYERNVARVYGKYQAMLAANNALDFDDLLMTTTMGLRNNPPILGELQERFQYILIDEYQDTNHAQYVLAHALALKHRNMCVVGDPDQSIYAWRGADIQNILDFEKDYADATVVRLEQNYRSTKTILAIASQLIAKNTRRKEKGLWTENEDGPKAKLIACVDEIDEANTIITELRDQHEKFNRPWSDMAIFYRMNSLSRVVEERLMRQRIPYQVARGVEFYNRKEIKDTLSYLRVISNPLDEISLERIINTPTRGIGDETVRKIQVYAVGSGLSLFAALQQVHLVEGLSTRAVKSIQNFAAMILKFREMIGHVNHDQEGGLFSTESSKEASVQTLMEQVVKQSGLEDLLNKSTDPDKPELANVKELYNSAAEFDKTVPEGTLEDYLSAISLMSDTDKIKDAGGAITLMTLHAAKGLEFPVVSIIGLEEGLLPHSRARTSPDELEEERRLCFVGITRAEHQLILSYAKRRTLMGRSERTMLSPFLGEMPRDMLDIVDHDPLSTSPHFGGLSQDGLDDDNPLTDDLQFYEGQRVKHPVFGVGTVKEINNMGKHTRAKVNFPRHGDKTLILEYCQLEALD